MYIDIPIGTMIKKRKQTKFRIGAHFERNVWKVEIARGKNQEATISEASLQSRIVLVQASRRRVFIKLY